VPADGTPERPGSWGVEDLTVIAVCRLAFPDDVEVRPHWRRLGPAACQIAVAFGASEWLIPADDASDAGHLAAGVGAAVRPA
jgi:2-iminoacetate synthase ThiH